jgi:hypothetical protein
LPITKEGLRTLARELGNRVAVVVACDDYEASMVSDILTRDGGRILVSSSGLTDEDIAKQEKEVSDALTEQAIRGLTDKAKLTSGRDFDEPV